MDPEPARLRHARFLELRPPAVASPLADAHPAADLGRRRALLGLTQADGHPLVRVPRPLHGSFDPPCSRKLKPSRKPHICDGSAFGHRINAVEGVPDWGRTPQSVGRWWGRFGSEPRPTRDGLAQERRLRDEDDDDGDGGGGCVFFTKTSHEIAPAGGRFFR